MTTLRSLLARPTFLILILCALCPPVLMSVDSAAAAETTSKREKSYTNNAPRGSAVPWLDRTFIQVYAGQMANMDMGDFLYAQNNLTKVMQDYMVTVGFGGEKHIWGGFSLGAEANVSLHWGYERDDETFGEFSTGLYLRYYFPWSKNILPSVAFGDGISYTGIIPNYEKRFGTGDLKERMESQWLNYLFVELELLSVKDIALFYRVHHRCTVFGLVGSELPGGINFHSIGLRYSF